MLVGLILICLLCSCGKENASKMNEEGSHLKENVDSFLPDVLRKKTFVYDELNEDVGDSLYTISFEDSSYKLYRDGGSGIISSGTASTTEEGTLTLTATDNPEGAGSNVLSNAVIEGTYRGSKFEEPSITLNLNGKSLKFTSATETTEYAYLAYLGVYSSDKELQGASQGVSIETTNDANDSEPEYVLILERWFEFYLFDGTELTKGHYEIYETGEIVLTIEEDDAKTKDTLITGTVEKANPFSQDSIVLELNIDGEECTLSNAEPLEVYDAAHAMGTYTLSKYTENIFTVKGVDGFVKAFGLLKETEEVGEAIYFPRSITNNVEEKNDYRVEYSADEDVLHFPASTPLLPRSGNIDEDSGYGSYWNAGTPLEFIKKAHMVDVPAKEIFEQSLNRSKTNFPENQGELKSIMPSTGIAKPLVLMIEFPDYHRPRHVTRDDLERLLFSLDEPESLSSFYYRSSYGKLTIEGKVCDWYRTKMNRNEYSSDSEIMAETINYMIDNRGLRLSDYDADGDGLVDALYVFWAGTMDGSNGMWNSAYRSTWSDPPSTWESKVSGYIFVPGVTVWSSVPPLKCNTNSLIHETGHLLGLNDYYSYDTDERKDRTGAVFTGGALEGGLGGMDMMDTNIGDHNVFSKYLLGWVDPTVIEFEDIPNLKGESFDIRPSAVAGDAIFIKMKPSDDMFTELLVIEAVSPIWNSSEYTRIKEPVIRLMRVNNQVYEEGELGNWRSFGFKYDNSYTSKKYISIVEADGKDEVQSFVPINEVEKISYETADYFKEGDFISSSTYPNTNGFDEYGNTSLPTGLTIEIEKLDSDGNAKVRLSYEEPKNNLKVIETVPESIVVPYKDEDTLEKISSQRQDIRIVYDSNIDFADDYQNGAIKLITGNEVVEDIQCEIAEDTLIIALQDGFISGKDYRVIIPANILKSTDDPDCVNDYMGIYGFVSE